MPPRAHRALLAAILALAAAAPAAASGRSLAQRPLSAANGEAGCRAEAACAAEQCSPTAYQLDLAAAGPAFPFAVSYTTTADAAATSFVFQVCSAAGALGACPPGAADGAACSRLARFALRARDEDLAAARAPDARPAGRVWDSCYPAGRGFLFDGPAALRSLAAADPSGAPGADACETFTVAAPAGRAASAGAPATLAALCEQNVTVYDYAAAPAGGAPAAIVTTAGVPDSCLFTLALASGRTAYGVLAEAGGGRPMRLMAPTALPAPEEPAAAPEGGSSGGDSSSSSDGYDDSAESGAWPEAAPAPRAPRSPSPYGPSPYGSRRRALSSALPARRRALFL